MVKYKDLKPSQIKEKPFETIGAQDLCSIETNFKGVLRKEGQLERGLKKIVHAVNWRQYFVVLSQGCMYIFTNEHSSSPKSRFSLHNYHKLRRNLSIPHSFDILSCTGNDKVYRFSCTTDTDRLDWMRALYVSLLSVHGEPLPNDKPKKDLTEEYALCESTVGNAMCYEVHDTPGSDSDSDSDRNYDEPDESLMIKEKRYQPDPTSIKTTPLPSIPTSDRSSFNRLQKSESEEPNAEYYDGASEATPMQRSLSVDTGITRTTSPVSIEDDKVVEHKIEPKSGIKKPMVAPKPKTNSRKKSPTSSSKGRMDTPSPSSPDKIETSEACSEPAANYMNNLTETPPNSRKTAASNDPFYLNSEDTGQVGDDPDVEYMFNGNRDEAARELHLTDEGTFLIRDSSEPKKKVLVVQVKTSLSSFRIIYLDNKIALEDVKFDSYHELVEHYKRHPIPIKKIKLTKGYNAKEESKPIVEPEEGAYEPVGQPIFKTKPKR